MKQAKGIIYGNAKTREVFFDGELLDPAESQKLKNHSPDGFMWGYYGSGPAQLALAICLKLFPAHRALHLYQAVKAQFVSQWQYTGDFEAEIEPIREWCETYIADHKEVFDAADLDAASNSE